MKRQKRPSRLSWLFLFSLLWLSLVSGPVHGAELVSPNTTTSETNETQPLGNSKSPLDALKDSWSKLKDELKASSADSEALLSLLEEAWIEIDELNSLLTQSIELSSTWKTISENLAHILDSQDKAHKKEILRLETERGWWIVGTVASSILAVGLGFAWLLK